MPAEKDTMYEIVIANDNLSSYKVRAAYVNVDERLFPGWTLLKDDQNSIRALVRSDRVLIIRRVDDAVPALKPFTVPSPALLAAARLGDS
jgi:hypothetical protein